jgi:hypothetical protein
MLQSSPTLPILFPFSPPLFYKNQPKALVASEGHHHKQSHEQNASMYGGRALWKGTRRRAGEIWNGLIRGSSLRSVIIQLRKNREAVYLHTNLSPHYGA